MALSVRAVPVTSQVMQAVREHTAPARQPLQFVLGDYDCVAEFEACYRMHPRLQPQRLRTLCIPGCSPMCPSLCIPGCSPLHPRPTTSESLSLPTRIGTAAWPHLRPHLRPQLASVPGSQPHVPPPSLWCLWRGRVKGPRRAVAEAWLRRPSDAFLPSPVAPASVLHWYGIGPPGLGLVHLATSPQLRLTCNPYAPHRLGLRVVTQASQLAANPCEVRPVRPPTDAASPPPHGVAAAADHWPGLAVSAMPTMQAGRKSAYMYTITWRHGRPAVDIGMQVLAASRHPTLMFCTALLVYYMRIYIHS